MGGFARCCCCPTCEGFSAASASFSWLGNSFSHSLNDIDEISCSSILCVADANWTEWHDEAEVTPWLIKEQVGAAGCYLICNGYGPYTTQDMGIEQQFILRFRMWYKRRWSTQLFIEKCDGGVRFRLAAKLIYLWPWNSTLTNRNRYRIREQACNPASPVVTGAWVEFGTDDGCEPGFPPGNYAALYGCEPETWTVGNCAACNDTTIVTIQEYRPCANFETSRTVGITSQCNACPDLLIPNKNRTPLILGEWEYLSECYACEDVPSAFDLTIPGCTSPITFQAYGNPLSNNYISAVTTCAWMDSFPTSPTVSIPCTISLTLT